MYDYDVNGYFLSGQGTSPNGHMTDQFKKPNHPTFSDESIYSSLTGTKPGSWQGPNHDQYVPFQEKKGSKKMSLDPTSILDTVQTGVDTLNLGKMSSAGFDFEAHQNKLLNSGPFAEATARQSVFLPQTEKPSPMQVAGLPMGVGGEGNKSAAAQLKELDEGISPDQMQKNQMKSLKAVDATQEVLKQTTGTPSAYTKTPVQRAADQEAARAKQAQEQAEIDKKLNIGVNKNAARPGETEEQRNRRLHPELY
jgi:hypothetical protein